MTEQEYIDLTDLQKLRNARLILKDITEENQPEIEKEEFDYVMSALYSWIKVIENKIITTDINQ